MNTLIFNHADMHHRNASWHFSRKTKLRQSWCDQLSSAESGLNIKRRHAFPELKRSSPRLNICRFVSSPRKNPTNQSRTSTYMPQKSIVSISERFFYPHALTHRYAGPSLFNNLFFVHPFSPKPPCPLRGCKDHPAPLPSHSSIENGISMSDGVSNGEVKKRRKSTLC